MFFVQFVPFFGSTSVENLLTGQAINSQSPLQGILKKHPQLSNIDSDKLEWLEEWLKKHSLENFIPLLSKNYKMIQQASLAEAIWRLTEKIQNASAEINPLVPLLKEGQLRILYSYIANEAQKIYKTTDQASIPAMNFAGIFASSEEGKACFEQLNESFLKLNNLSKIAQNPYKAQVYWKAFGELPINKILEQFSQHEEEIFSDLRSDGILEALNVDFMNNEKVFFKAFPEEGFMSQWAKMALQLEVTSIEIGRHLRDTLLHYFCNKPFFVTLPFYDEIMIGANFPVLGQGLTSQEFTPDSVKKALQEVFGRDISVGPAGSRLVGKITSPLPYAEIIEKIKTVLNPKIKE